MPTKPDDTLLILSNSGGYGGAPRSMEYLVHELSQHFIIHICAENSIHVTNLQKQAGPRLHVHPLKKGKGFSNMVRNLWYLRKLIRKIHPTRALSNTNKAALFLGILNRLGGLGSTPKFVFVRDDQWRNRKLIWALLGKATLLVPSPAVRELPHYLPQWPVFEIPNFARPAKNAPAYSTTSRMVLCLAMVSRWKGIHLLVDSFAQAMAKQPDLKLVVVGRIVDKEYHQSILSQIQSLGIADHVQFESYTNLVEPFYQKAMVVVNTSISEFGGPETFGRTLIEAWAHSCPVVSFDCGGPRYIIDEGINGFLVPEKDTKKMAERLVTLAQDDDLRVHMGAQGLQKLQTKFYPKRSTKILLDVLEA